MTCSRIFMVFLVIGFAPLTAHAQNFYVGSGSAQSYNSTSSGQVRTPIPLKQIMSGANAAAPTTSSYNYNNQSNYNTAGQPSAGVPYSFSMTPELAIQNRAQRDAYAQNSEAQSLAYLQDGAYTQTYEEEYKKYQKKLAGQGGFGGVAGAASQQQMPVFTTKTKVRYKKKKAKYKKPKRIFKAYN